MQTHLIRNKQRGVGLSGMLIWSALVVVIVILGMKLIPSFVEYSSIKRALVAIANEANAQNARPAEIRESFNKRATIDNIKAINGRDIEIRKEGSKIVLSVSYAVKTPLFANVSLYIDFNATSNQ
ncbi:DUF4845 domain-containing protein [Nitrosomonas sp.]|uniref:DUF4845 domain-containing protein n=1 Tax=Nitrosomonas sp. TaxID=42353 RepID=UPI00260F7179|nr:DUF4845 domain-containing protein [Nitrosomonas sp.]MCW5600637.1 DUF4845 domain-containing protein [Nitrosomonas sp.]